MNPLELRYAIFKQLTEQVYAASLISPEPGKPVQIGVMTKAPDGEMRHFMVTVEEV